MTDCPKCGASLGLLRADEVKVGAIYQHRHRGCDALLVLVAAGNPTELVVRLATTEETWNNGKESKAMSYDIYIRSKHFCSHCGRDSNRESDSYSGELPEPTYNLTPIFDLALTGEAFPNPDVGEGAVVLLKTKTNRPRGLRVLSGRKVGDSIPMIAMALKRIADDPEPFRVLEPSNGWGTLKDAVYVFERMREAAVKCNPEATWDIR